ncbi:integrase [Spiribacter halobius]|uniref:Integrase n=2 Tax=Sediminicurvatus halobius TaxID=2182432 RepID=A0A2U2N4W9_9GAMM|nr:integrase [Spiribacter halobius]
MPGAEWDEAVWLISGGRLTRLSGKNVRTPTLAFCYAKKLGGEPLEGEWGELAKALTVLRFHRHNQNIVNLRTFVHGTSYVAHAAAQGDPRVATINRGVLDRACDLIREHYTAGSAYNLHKGVNELAAHLDQNKLVKVLLDYRYARLRRPDNTGGVGFKRLDSNEAKEETRSEKMADGSVYELIGELYRTVPLEHPGRVYVLMLTLLACLGRRFSEIALMPLQSLKRDEEGRGYVEVFGRKQSVGEVFTPSRQVFCMSEAVDVVAEALIEAQVVCAPPREVAAQMRLQQGPDLRFLEDEPKERRYRNADLAALGLPGQLLSTNGWIRRSNLATPQGERNKRGQKWVTDRHGVEAYCRKAFTERMLEPVHIDQFQKRYFLDDLLFCQFLYLGGRHGERAFWLATPISHEMMRKWVERSLPEMAEQYAPNVSANNNIRSHQFRHTINTLLDEGGLPELLQTRWFLRKTPRDTKAYQNTSREKNVLEVRAAIQAGRASGTIVEELEYIPVDKRDAYLKARVKAVHDVGTGICVHNFSQSPCPRHLECLANCRDYLHVRGDAGRIEEIKHKWAMTKIAKETAEKNAAGKLPKKSVDWIAHNEKKLQTLERQLAENGVERFDPHAYLEEVTDGQAE